MFQFCHDFLKKCLHRQDFELCYVDTYSFYLAVSGDSLYEIVNSGLRQSYEVDKKNWLATEKNSGRTPGLFRPEFVGTRGVWLIATCYFVHNQK